MTRPTLNDPPPTNQAEYDAALDKLREGGKANALTNLGRFDRHIADLDAKRDMLLKRREWWICNAHHYGATQTALAEATGLTQGRISQIVNGLDEPHDPDAGPPID